MDIIRRKKPVAVEARRVQQPAVIEIPGPGTQPGAQAVPPPMPGVTQTIVYLNVPESKTAPPPQPAAAPQQIHYHTTHVYHAPRRRRLGKGTSLLGSLGFVLGAVAAGSAYWPQAVWLAKPISVVGFALAVLGYVGALLLGRVGRGMPFLGMLLCAGAYVIWLKNTGQPIAPPKLDLNLLLPGTSDSSPAKNMTGSK